MVNLYPKKILYIIEAKGSFRVLSEFFQSTAEMTVYYIINIFYMINIITCIKCSLVLNSPALSKLYMRYFATGLSVIIQHDFTLICFDPIKSSYFLKMSSNLFSISSSLKFSNSSCSPKNISL